MKNKNKQTKFPVARIKKIMQKDEEVGKVAQATPIIISKALERFLALIVSEASNVAVKRGSKRIEAYHLKNAVETTEMLDFLKEIVEGVADPSAGGTIDLDGENGEGAKKKRGKMKKVATDTPEATAGTSASASTAPGGEQQPKKRRRRKKDADAPAGSKPARATAPLTKREDGEGEGEEKSEADNMVVDEYDDDGSADFGGYSRTAYSSKQSEADSEWKGADEDTPYMPRS